MPNWRPLSLRPSCTPLRPPSRPCALRWQPCPSRPCDAGGRCPGRDTGGPPPEPSSLRWSRGPVSPLPPARPVPPAVRDVATTMGLPVTPQPVVNAQNASATLRALLRSTSPSSKSVAAAGRQLSTLYHQLNPAQQAQVGGSTAQLLHQACRYLFPASTPSQEATVHGWPGCRTGTVSAGGTGTAAGQESRGGSGVAAPYEGATSGGAAGAGKSGGGGPGQAPAPSGRAGGAPTPGGSSGQAGGAGTTPTWPTGPSGSSPTSGNPSGGGNGTGTGPPRLPQPPTAGHAVMSPHSSEPTTSGNHLLLGFSDGMEREQGGTPSTDAG